MHPYLQKLKNSKTPISFPFFCNILRVTCSHIPFVCIYHNVTLFILEYVHKILSDPPLVISPPLCRVTQFYSICTLLGALAPRNYLCYVSCSQIAQLIGLTVLAVLHTLSVLD